MTASITAIGYSGGALGTAMSLQGYVQDNGYNQNEFMTQVVEALQGLGLIGGDNGLQIAGANRGDSYSPSGHGISGSSGHSLA